MKNIILVSPKLGIGGIQRALTNIANWFAENDFQVTFISCKNEEVFYDLDKRVEVIVPSKKHPGKGGNIVSHYLYIIKFLRKEFKKHSAENIISFGDTFNPLVLIAGLRLKKKIHISDRTSPDYKFKSYVKILKKNTYPLSTTFIAQTTRAAKWNEEKFGKKLNIKTIPNPARKVQVQDIGKKNIVLYVGRFAWEKAPDRLIKSFAKLENRQGFKLRMCGDGPLLAKMQQLAIDLKIADEVEFLGRVNNVDFHLSEASIYVLPSVLEGFPNALCEAMSAGLPSICFDTIPFEDLGIPNEDFLVAEENSKNNLEFCIQKLIDSKEVRTKIGNSALKINDTLDNDIICQKFADLIAP
ncbi:glycosyltransferase [Brumimicrobium mesophilum]|uniref:glycosyltransferase n=1 Tax=Brumimicrobium mesophilum TaxID=392717 RepID=UPI00131E150D|nr:glycosyltransferase [Brumimicrobium mesophilum]